MPLILGLYLGMLTVASFATDIPALSIVAALAFLFLFMGLWYLPPRRDPSSEGAAHLCRDYCTAPCCVKRRTDGLACRWIMSLSL